MTAENKKNNYNKQYAEEEVIDKYHADGYQVDWVYSGTCMPPKIDKKVPKIRKLNSSWTVIPFFCQINNHKQPIFQHHDGLSSSQVNYLLHRHWEIQQKYTVSIEDFIVK